MADETPGLRKRDIQGLKYLDKLLPLLERLHDVLRRRPAARSLGFFGVRGTCRGHDL
jgi:hypothetical protein